MAEGGAASWFVQKKKRGKSGSDRSFSIRRALKKRGGLVTPLGGGQEDGEMWEKSGSTPRQVLITGEAEI